jgi:hypothetical protein
MWTGIMQHSTSCLQAAVSWWCYEGHSGFPNWAECWWWSQDSCTQRVIDSGLIKMPRLWSYSGFSSNPGNSSQRGCSGWHVSMMISLNIHRDCSECPLPRIVSWVGFIWSVHTCIFVCCILQLPIVPSGQPPKPHPHYLRDCWDSEHVRMPCSEHNLYPVKVVCELGHFYEKKWVETYIVKYDAFWFQMWFACWIVQSQKSTFFFKGHSRSLVRITVPFVIIATGSWMSHWIWGTCRLNLKAQ